MEASRANSSESSPERYFFEVIGPNNSMTKVYERYPGQLSDDDGQDLSSVRSAIEKRFEEFWPN